MSDVVTIALGITGGLVLSFLLYWTVRGLVYLILWLLDL